MNTAALASYVLLTAFTPGPNNIMSMSNSARFGLGKALRFCLGVLLGFFVDMTLCVVATSLLFEYIPRVEPVMKWIGAAYIVFLAWMIFRDRPAAPGSEPRLDPCAMSTGMVMQLVNVKVILYGITAFSVFVLPHHRSFSATVLTVLTLSLVGFVATCCWAVFGTLFQEYYARHRRPMNAAMALMLVYCAVASVL